MGKIKYIVAAILSVLVMSNGAIAMPGHGGTAASGNVIQSRGARAFLPDRYDVADLPTLTVDEEGALVQVKDGADAEDTTVGGGAFTVLARWTGSAWVNAGDGQAAGSAEVSDATIGAAGNGDTAHAYSKDDIHDWVIGIDPDFSGVIEADELPADAVLTSELGTAYDEEAELDALFTAKQDAATAATDSEVAALQTDDLVTLSGVLIGSTNLATFTGTTITDNSTIKVALQELEVAVEAAGAADAFTVKVDAGATGGYLGAANSDGVLRTDGTILTYSDGGDFVTIGAHAYLADIAGITAAQGDVIYFDGTDWVNLAPGISGQYLQTQGAAANPQWASTSVSGDIENVGDVASGAAFTADGAGNTLYFEGSTANTFETALTAADPGADYTITLPAATGTVLLADGVGTSLTALNGENIQDDTIDDDSIDFADVTGADLTLTDATAITASGLITANLGLTIATGQALTVGVVQWDDGSDQIDGEQIAADTIDDDSIDFTDVTLADITFDVGSVDTTEFGYLDGVTSAIQTQLDGKEATDAEIARMDTADTVGADWETQDNIAESMGNDNDWERTYDTDISDNDSDFTTALTGAGLVFETANAAADAKVIFNNSDATYGVTLYVENLVYSGAITFDGSGDSAITLANNASIAGSGYQVFFEGGNLISVESGTEKELLNVADGATLTGTTWDYTGVTNFLLPTSADAAGEIGIDTTAHQLQYHDGGGTVITFDSDADAAGYIWKSDGSGNFTLQADATGGTPTWDTVSNPAADASLTHDAGEETSFLYTGNFTTGSQFLVQQLTGDPSGGVLFEVRAADSSITVFEAGDGTNVWTISPAGLLSNAGTATLNFAAASDLTVAGGQIAFNDLAAAAANLGANAITVNSVEIVGSDGEVNAAAIEDSYLSNSGDIGTGVYDFGSATTFEIWNSTSDMALAVAGQIGLQVTDDQLVFHGGAAGEIQGEAAKYLGEKLTMVFDPSDAYDQESTYRALPLPPIGDDAPEGITIVEWNLNYVGGDPTTELDADLMCDTTPDYNPAAGATVMDVLDTTAGASNADTGFDSATCANGSNMYLRFGADPTDANVMIEFTLWYYAEED